VQLQNVLLKYFVSFFIMWCMRKNVMCFLDC
jgi:hypothetical protein